MRGNMSEYLCQKWNKFIVRNKIHIDISENETNNKKQSGENNFQVE